MNKIQFIINQRTKSNYEAMLRTAQKNAFDELHSTGSYFDSDNYKYITEDGKIKYVVTADVFNEVIHYLNIIEHAKQYYINTIDTNSTKENAFLNLICELNFKYRDEITNLFKASPLWDYRKKPH